MKKKNQFPKGWTESRVRRVLRHYERQTEDAATAEDDASYRNRKEAVMIIPVKLVPAVRKLISRRAG